jgi:sorbitol-specific phosphotransferase system component IIA
MCKNFQDPMDINGDTAEKVLENVGKTGKRINENFAEIGHMGIQINGEIELNRNMKEFFISD